MVFHSSISTKADIDLYTTGELTHHYLQPTTNGGSLDPNDDNKRSSDPGPTHGGSFDPNEYINRSSGPGPTHGGDFDPNQFDASRLPQQSQQQQFSSQAMASNTAQGASYERDSTDSSDQTFDTSNPMGAFLGVQFCPSLYDATCVKHSLAKLI